MKRFLRHHFGAVLTGIALLLLLVACQTPLQGQSAPPAATPIETTPASSPSPPSPAEATTALIQLPPLPYDYGALEPFIDAATMQLHHDKHHATYVNKLNQALQAYPDLQNQELALLVSNLGSVPETIRATIRNNGGGHLNHTMFWQIMAPKAGGEPTGAIAEAINQTFGSFDNFKQQFNQAGADQFGSGWVWLVRNSQGQLQITTTSNQDSPLMEGAYPILGNDVWEHAYYLKYQNKRADYLNNWWNVVNWAEVDRRFAQAKAIGG